MAKILTGFVCLVFVVAGCDEAKDEAKKLAKKAVSGDGYVCEPGDTQQCWCPDDGDDPTGAQRCNTNGKFWWKCYCSTTDDGEFQDLDRKCKNKNTNEECECDEEDAIPVDEDDIGDPDDIVEQDTEEEEILPIEDTEEPIEDTEEPIEQDPIRDSNPAGIDWVNLDMGAFIQGNDPVFPAEADEAPKHSVAVPPFMLARTETTVAQYRICVDAGVCQPTVDSMGCSYENGHNNFADAKEDYPVNCVTHPMAVQFCEFAGGRLPTESEWEYAAKSAGETTLYPWGDEEPSRDLTVAMGAADDMPPCSVPEGNTFDGLCDMAGNMEEWVVDDYHYSYNGAPTDGSAWIDGDVTGMTRGGNYQCTQRRLRNADRKYMVRGAFMHVIGFRCAMPLASPALAPNGLI